MHPEVSLGSVAKCIRAKAKDNLSGLSEDTFGMILGLGALMLARCKLHIETRLAEADEHGSGSAPAMPADLIDDRWIERAERISRFCAEMVTLRARVRHVNGLDDERPRQSFTEVTTPFRVVETAALLTAAVVGFWLESRPRLACGRYVALQGNGPDLLL